MGRKRSLVQVQSPRPGGESRLFLFNAISFAKDLNLSERTCTVFEGSQSSTVSRPYFVEMLLSPLDQLDMSSRPCHPRISVDFSSKVLYSVKKCSISRRRCRGKCVRPSTSLKRRFNVHASPPASSVLRWAEPAQHIQRMLAHSSQRGHPAHLHLPRECSK